MTDSEAQERAERIASLDLPKDLLVIEMAREFQRIAAECGWQKEALAECQTRADNLHRYLDAIFTATLEDLK